MQYSRNEEKNIENKRNSVIKEVCVSKINKIFTINSKIEI